ncbi:MAG: SDR family oxidoreductase [Aromatoleum sp.]|jgi:NAD(P)-dependent dehydrogenase (short-subunit alcohol dehydrogenase family)|uniref:SDR family oxidoreductase n=1 Tax=Aromatoleum sp. TaxID=2307007 RepID=UPI00289398AF|nr:SDR family oxidoreductase [Aromatoleum sp.]MDT3671230.1 SDR family oxidoreductase [Aromatoleum sp.]
MSGRLAGKVAIVTGGGGGIGRATVERFAEEGATVVVADCDGDSGMESAAAAGAGAVFMPLDAGDEASWRELGNEVLARFGALDVLVNNAAFRIPLTLDETTVDLWQRNQRVTSEGVFLGMKMASGCMAARGAIVNVASLAAFVGLPESFPYSAAKGAVRAMSRSAALHFAADERRIRVNVVAPGSVLTDAAARQMERLGEREGTGADSVLARLTAAVPLKRMAEPREIANAIVFLASDEASFVTGAELLVDGGATAV